MRLIAFVCVVLCISAIRSLPAYSPGLICSVCVGSINAASAVIRMVMPDRFVMEVVQIICIRRYESKKVCGKVAEEIAPLAIDNAVKRYMSADRVCQWFCGRAYRQYLPEQEIDRILASHDMLDTFASWPLRPNLEPFVSRETKFIENTNRLSILHLSDIHLDNAYQQSSSVYCEYPICCHVENGFPNNPASQAKKYGSKDCDSPQVLIDSMLHSLQNIDQQIDIILITGDLSAHNQWQKNTQTINANNDIILHKIHQNKKLNNSIVITAQGNNDYYPDHQYDGSNQSKQHKLVQVIEIELASPYNKATFISLNTIVYDNLNLYLLGDQSYAIYQLMILEQQLKKHEQVYILGHISINLVQAASQYATIYRALMKKYEWKVKGQFFGHTHLDQLIVYTNPLNPDQLTNFGFITPSVSPYMVKSSRYRIYDVAHNADGSSGVSNYIQYAIKDLAQIEAQWQLQYDFRARYSLSNQKQSDSPITKSQIRNIVQKIMRGENQMRQLYLQGKSGYCQIYDDPNLQRKCLKNSLNYMGFLFGIIEFLQGRWSYSLHSHANTTINTIQAIKRYSPIQ